MAALIKKALSVFRSKLKRNGNNAELEDPNLKPKKPLQTKRKMVFREDSSFSTTLVNFGTAKDIEPINLKEEVLSLRARAPVSVVNRGQITITDRFIIVDKTAMPGIHEKPTSPSIPTKPSAPMQSSESNDTVHGKPDFIDKKTEKIAMQKQRKTDLSFIVENRGRMRIVYQSYLVLDDPDSFIKSPLFSLLADGITWESSVIMRKNSGTIQKSVEIVTQLGDEDAKILDTGCAHPFTYSDLKIMEKHNLTVMDMQCFRQALCSIRP